MPEPALRCCMTHADHHTLFDCHRHRDLHAELVRRSHLALGDALDFGRVQRVQLVLRVSPLRMRTLGHGNLRLQCLRQLTALALHVADHSTQPCPKPSDLAVHAPVLLGMRVAARLVLGHLAHPRVALTQRDPGFLRGIDQLLACPIQQATVGGMCNGFGLHLRVEHNRVKTTALDHVACACRFDRLRQQPLATSPPMRWRQRTRLDGSHRRSCRKYRSPLKCCSAGSRTSAPQRPRRSARIRA